MFMYQQGFESQDFSLAAATAVVFFLISMVFVYRSFYGMRIHSQAASH